MAASDPRRKALDENGRMLLLDQKKMRSTEMQQIDTHCNTNRRFDNVAKKNVDNKKDTNRTQQKNTALKYH